MKQLEISSKIRSILYRLGQNNADFAYFYEVINSKYSASGLAYFYRLGEMAFHHPEKARIVLQTLLCNFTNLLKEGVVMAYHDNPAHHGSISLLGNPQNIETVYEKFGELYEKHAKFAPAEIAQRTKLIDNFALSSRIDKLLSTAGLMEYLRKGKDPLNAYLGILQYRIFATSPDPSPLPAIEQLVDLRHSMVHNDILPTIPIGSPLYDASRSPGLQNADTAVKYVLLLLSIPPVIYAYARLAEGVKFKEDRRWMRLKAFLTGPMKNYGVVDPLSAATSSGRRRSKGRKVQWELAGVLRGAAIIAAIAGCLIFFRATIHHFSGNGDFRFRTDKEITDYIHTKNSYDNALLYKERQKIVGHHKNLLDEKRESELRLRAQSEGWPKPSWYRTIWHTGTPRSLHFKEDQPVAESQTPSTTEQNGTD